MENSASGRSSHLLLWWVLGCFCFLSISYGLLIPAWEANDEIDHVANIEYLLQHRTLVPLRLQTWHETHQPPLYYLLAATWQSALGIDPFSPAELPRTIGPMTAPTLQLAYVHKYTPVQRAAAVAVHELRLFSTLLGLATVVLTYGIALELVQSNAVAAAAAAFVGFLPKFIVISAAVTNDSLGVMLCSLALFLALRCQREASARLAPLLMGLAAGGAVITKLNSIPVVCFLLASLLVLPRKGRAERARQFGLAALGTSVSTGWWLVYNHSQGRGWLGQKGVARWLNERLPGLIREVSWTDHERFLNFVPSQLFQTSWYNGGWNQFVLPFAFNFVCSVLAVVCCCHSAAALLRGDNSIRKFDPGFLLITGCWLAALASVFIIARTTTQAEGRIAYVGLSAFAIVAVTGAIRIFRTRQRLALLLWPVLFLLLNGYVVLRFIIPFRAF